MLMSNTFFFEEVRSWTGLLIEASQKLFKKLMTSGRNAYMINACLNTEASSDPVTFLDNGNPLGGIKEKVLNAYVFIHSETTVLNMFTTKNLSIRIDIERQCQLNRIYFPTVDARWIVCAAYRLLQRLKCFCPLHFSINFRNRQGLRLHKTCH